MLVGKECYVCGRYSSAVKEKGSCDLIYFVPNPMTFDPTRVVQSTHFNTFTWQQPAMVLLYLTERISQKLSQLT